MWQGGNQAAAPPSSQTKDTRPLRDRSFQAKMRQDVGTYLINTGFDVVPQMLQNITGKDFRVVFQHLITCLDPLWPFELELRFEDHFMQALRAMKYPYVGQIDMKWLPTPAAMHSWPALLGMLHWLAELGKVYRPLSIMTIVTTHRRALDSRAIYDQWKPVTARSFISSGRI